MNNRGQREEGSQFIRGSGNVFADLGLPNPEEALAKARLAQAIAETIARRGLSQAEAAEIMGVDQPKVSAIVRGRLRGFTQDRLMRFLTALGDDVEITVRRPQHYEEAGRLSVTIT